MTSRAGEHGEGLSGANLRQEDVDADSGHRGLVRLRNTFTITSHRSAGGHERHLITAPKHGPDRARARRAILDVLRHADTHHHHVSFLITLGDYTQHSVSIPHGYEANFVLLHCRIEQNDPYAWLQRQISPALEVADVNAIIGVCVSSWPQTEPATEEAARRAV